MWVWLSITILAYSAVILFLTLQAKAPSPIRRFAGNLTDIGATTYVMIQTGEIGIPLFALFLWITIGNGFRFGIPALLVSAILSAIGFSVVVSVSDLWQQHPAFAGGVWFTLIVLPLYAAHLIRMLNTALQRAEEASAAKSRFLSRMSHELRTPLNGIVGAADLLNASKRLSPEERSLLQVIRDSVQASLSQINNVLDFSKIEAGKLVLERKDLDLHEVINEAVGMVKPTAQQKGLRFLVQIAPETPFRLVGDPHHLRAILLNLLSNAAKFTEHGYVCLEVSSQGDSEDGKTLIRFEVRDTGIGISPDAMERIFESFVQEDASTTRRHGGTGLGTTIAKQLVELMGGRIGAHSIKGQGSVFWCEIPFDRQSRATDQTAETLPGVRVVLLTEDASLLQHYQHVLETMQGQPVRARSPDEAIEVLARSMRIGNPIHAIVVDATLAFGHGGEHHCTELCDKALAANVVVILAADTAPPREQLREWGYSAVLPSRAASSLVYAALRASPARLTSPSPGVVSIAPWVWSNRGGTRPRILVADDNRTNLMIVKRMLEQGGYEAETVETGDEALERLCAGGYRAAVLDMHMPGLDGIGVLRRYRTVRPRSRLPIIVLTANATFEAQQASAEAGADAYLAKPVTAAQLLGELERLVHDTEVEVLARRTNRPGSQTAEGETVIDTSVLAELDRLYDDPSQLARLIQEYEREGRALLDGLARACVTRSHPAFCDGVHALKGNAANVGAVKLVQECREAGAVGMIEFMRDRDRLLGRLQEAFTASLTALHELVRTSADTAGLGHTAGGP